MTVIWPAPETRARIAEAAEVPRGARLIQRAAEAAGWTVVPTYARGTLPAGRVTKQGLAPSKVVDSLALRMRQGDRRAVAVWLDGRFDFAALFGDVAPQTCNATQLRAALGGVLPASTVDSSSELPSLRGQEGGASVAAGAPPAPPLPPGMVWGRVHVGDTVRGADQRPWQVAARGRPRRWVAGGEDALFTLRLGEREISVWRSLADPVDLIAATDRTELAAAAAALIDAGLHFEILEESMTDAFTSAVPEPKHDRFGRYLLPDPTTGKEKAWTRVSTVARTLADEYGLTQWKLRQVAKGLGLRPDLVAGAAAADPDRDKSDLQEIADQAMAAAESKAGANFGTALHSFTRRLDAGEPVTALRPPVPLDRDLASYASLCKAAGLRVLESERVVVLPDLGIAGRFDRIVSQPAGNAKADPRAVLDLKSGKDLSYSWLEIAIQQALYARAPLMWNPVTESYEPKPAVDLTRALVLHLPVGQANAQLYGIDIAKGWEYLQLAMQVRTARSGAKKLAWLVEPQNPAAVALHKVTTAGTREELAELWERFNAAGVWTEEVNAAAMTRFKQLQSEAESVAVAA